MFDVMVGLLSFVAVGIIILAHAQTQRPTFRAFYRQRSNTWGVQRKVIADFWVPYRPLRNQQFDSCEEAEAWVIQHLAELLEAYRLSFGNAITYSHPAVRNRCRKKAPRH